MNSRNSRQRLLLIDINSKKVIRQLTGHRIRHKIIHDSHIGTVASTMAAIINSQSEITSIT